MGLGPPLGYSQWLCALVFYLSNPLEIILVGGKEDTWTRELLDTVWSKWIPDKVVAVYDPAHPAGLSQLPVFAGRKMLDGLAAAYVCRNNTCQSPVTDKESLKEQLII